jgi:hypothetical protein
MKNIAKGLVFALVITFAFASCAKQPVAQMDAAKAAVQAVADAKGTIYAKEELSKLNSDLKAALDEVTLQSKKFFKKYGPAKEMLAKVVADADAVKAMIPGRIEAAKNEAQAALDAAKAACDEAAALLAKAPKGKGTKADIEAMKADLDGLAAQMTEAQNAFQAEDYFGARDKAKAITDKANAVKGQVNAAIAKVKK